MGIKKSISIVLPNYNGRHLMEAYIPSIFDALKRNAIDYEFLVIDDCSSDDSVVFLTENYPEIKLLQNKINSGFSVTCNKGIFAATKDLIFLVNSDVKISANFFDNQFKYFQKSSTFGVMGRIMNFDGQKIEDAARIPRFKGGKFKANQFFYSEKAADFVYTTYLSGANALIDRTKILEIGGFDEIFSPFYFEDFDLGLRAWKMGWKLYYDHQSICYHRVSASTNQMNRSNFVKVIYNRNSFLLQAIHLEGFERKLWYFQLFSFTLINHILKGEFWIFESLKLFLKMRKQIDNSILKIELQQAERQVSINLNDIIKIQKNNIRNLKINWL